MNQTPEDRQRSLDLLNQTHVFPTRVMIKVIGINETSFVAAVIEVVRLESSDDEIPPHQVREAKGGKHVAITLEPQLENAECVLAIYARLQVLEGVVMLL
ncbi:MAG: DUF493 domain-containing protein [Pirellulales bacterium]